jgi:hypothetical protein
MEPFLVTMVIIGLLIVGGIVISWRINAHRLPGRGLFRRVRRLRKRTPLPDGTTVEETVVETTVKELPVEEEP